MESTDLNQKGKPVINVTDKQRTISGVTGGLLLAMGIFGFGKSSFRRALRMTAGSLLIMRAVTGYCPFTALQNEKNPDGHEENLNEYEEKIPLTV